MLWKMDGTCSLLLAAFSASQGRVIFMLQLGPTWKQAISTPDPMMRQRKTTPLQNTFRNTTTLPWRNEDSCSAARD